MVHYKGERMLGNWLRSAPPPSTSPTGTGQKERLKSAGRGERRGEREAGLKSSRLLTGEAWSKKRKRTNLSFDPLQVSFSFIASLSPTVSPPPPPSLYSFLSPALLYPVGLFPQCPSPSPASFSLSLLDCFEDGVVSQDLAELV